MTRTTFRCADSRGYVIFEAAPSRFSDIGRIEVLNELHRSQESAYNLRDASRQSHINRAKLCSKILKYPHVEDYTVSDIKLYGIDGH